MRDEDVYDALTSYMREHGYDALYNVDADCGCSIDDLQPCCNGGIPNCCLLGVAVDCPSCELSEGCLGRLPYDSDADFMCVPVGYCKKAVLRKGGCR